MATAIFAGGCFWCTEAVMQALKGVGNVRSGYVGGRIEHPGYEAVSTGVTGHAEAVEVTFDPATISYEQLVEVFFGTHDPTQMNRQGNDIGTQYRSIIFVADESQRQVAQAVKSRLAADNTFGAEIVTSIEPTTTFYPAETEHQNYYANNSGNPYCQAIIGPKGCKTTFKIFWTSKELTYCSVACNIARSCSTIAACAAGFTCSYTLATVPSGRTSTEERTVPKYARPRNFFSCQNP